MYDIIIWFLPIRFEYLYFAAAWLSKSVLNTTQTYESEFDRFFSKRLFYLECWVFFWCLEKIPPKIYSEIQLNLTFNRTYSYGGHDTLATIYYIIPQLFCSHVLFSCVLFSCAKFIQSILQIIHHLKQSFYSLQFSHSSFVSIEFVFFSLFASFFLFASFSLFASFFLSFVNWFMCLKECYYYTNYSFAQIERKPRQKPILLKNWAKHKILTQFKFALFDDSSVCGFGHLKCHEWNNLK